MRLKDLIVQALDAPRPKDISPNAYKRERGRCPPGYHADEKGRCQKESERQLKRRTRDSRKHRNLRKRREKRHPPLFRWSSDQESPMKISEQIRRGSSSREAKTLSEKENVNIAAIDKHVKDIVQKWSQSVGGVEGSIRKLLSDLHRLGVTDKRYQGVAKTYTDLADAMENFVDQMHYLQKQSVGELTIKGHAVEAQDAMEFIRAIKAVGKHLLEALKAGETAQKAMPKIKMVGQLVKAIKSAGKTNNDILRKVKSAIGRDVSTPTFG